MVRRSLAETLNEQALQFLSEGSETRPAESPVSAGPLPGFDRAFHLEFWSKEDREKLNRFFLTRYREDLERAGIKTTRDGLVESSRTHVPNTKGLDVEIRWLRREVALLSELVRNLLRIVVYAGGIEPERLRDYLCEINPDAREQEGNGGNEEPAPRGNRDDDRSRPGNGLQVSEAETRTEAAPTWSGDSTAGAPGEALSLPADRLPALTPEEPSWMECPRCGRELPTTVHACLFCGRPL